MVFDYDVYYRQNFAIPSLLIAFCLFLLLSILVNIYKILLAVKKGSELPQDEIVKNVIGIAIVVILIVLNAIPLIRGGVFLICERENDAITVSGTIDNTVELPSFGGAKYGVEQNHGHGEAIVIDGVRYFLVTFGEFKQGDQVLVKVLPKSRFILEIELFHENDTAQ